MRDYVEIADQYARDVQSGKRVAGRLEQKAVERFQRDRKKGAFVFDPAEAAKPCAFVEQLHHVEGRWEKGNGRIVLEPWQVFLLVNLFGFRKADGTRRFDTAYIEVARKNAKSTLAAAIGLYCLTMEDEVGPRVYCAATTGDQARIIFNTMKKMVEKNSDLQDAFGLEVLANAIVAHPSSGSIKPINAKASTQDGLNPHAYIIDELHAHKDRALFDVLRSARGARKNPLSYYVTTAGYNLESVCYEQREFVAKVLEGVLDADHYFAIVYSVDREDDPFDETAWPKANPNLGVSVQTDELRGYASEAKISPQVAGEFKTKRLNVWLASGAAWLNMTSWQTCADPTVTEESLRGFPCWIGVDLSSKDDIAAVAPVWLRNGAYYALPRFYLPRDMVYAAANKKAHYVAWANEGRLVLTDGDLIDYNRIEADIRGICERHDVRAIAFDPYQATQITGNLSNDGLPALTVSMSVATMSDPAKELEARIKAGKFIHDGNPVFTWMASNVEVKRDWKDNIFPRKSKPNSPQKIDGIVATIVAIGRSLAEPVVNANVPSVYETRDLLVL